MSQGAGVARPRDRLGDAHLAVGDEEVEVAVEFGVERNDAEAGERHTRGPQAAQSAHVFETGRAAEVAVQGVGLVHQMGQEEIESAVAVEVFGKHSHPRLGLTVKIVRHSLD